jgi:hypothetical protein
MTGFVFSNIPSPSPFLNPCSLPVPLSFSFSLSFLSLRPGRVRGPFWTRARASRLAHGWSGGARTRARATRTETRAAARLVTGLGVGLHICLLPHSAQADVYYPHSLCPAHPAARLRSPRHHPAAREWHPHGRVRVRARHDSAWLAHGWYGGAHTQAWATRTEPRAAAGRQAGHRVGCFGFSTLGVIYSDLPRGLCCFVQTLCSSCNNSDLYDFFFS